jgi:hypothetical protein
MAFGIIERVLESELPADEEAELITSITRQLMTYDGHAALFTGRGQFWVRAAKSADREWTIDINHNPNISVFQFIEKWEFDAHLVPDILRRLTVAQSAEFTNRKGMKLRFWVNPKSKRTNLARVVDDAE